MDNGNIWDDFIKEKILGTGSLGLTYKVKYKKTNKFYALKEIKKENISKDNFSQIMNYMKELNSENIITIIKEYENYENYYIIMDLCLLNLEDYINQRDNDLSIEEIKLILFQLNNALKIIKEKNIIIGNLNFSNILLSIDKLEKISLKLSDFYFENENYTFNSLYTLSPEYLEKKILSEKSDIWSLGVIIYFLLFKKYPFKGEKIEIILNEIKSNQIKFSKYLDLNDLLSKMLIIDENKRISWDEYFNHKFFQNKNDNFKFNCNIHSKIIKYYCSDCKINFCELCFNNHSQHKFYFLSKIGLTFSELNKIENLMKEINENLQKYNVMKKYLYSFFHNIKKIKLQNSSIYENENDNNFKNYYIKCLNDIKKISEIDIIINKLKKLDNFYYIINSNLKKVKSIESHEEKINYVSYFPSSNIISISNDKSIKIYNPELEIIQIIKIEKSISYMSIKDENNFAICFEKNIQTYIKKEINNENKFILNQEIKNAHNDYIGKILYSSKGNLFSSSEDKTIKLWVKNKNNNNYQNITIISNIFLFASFLLLEKENILIASGMYGTKFYNLNFFNFLFYIDKTICGCANTLAKINNDKIIIGGGRDCLMSIISISEKKIIKQIKNEFWVLGICVIENKEIFLVGGVSKDIRIYRTDNFEFVQTIKNAHEQYIVGITQLNNGLIISYSYDHHIKIWDI